VVLNGNGISMHMSLHLQLFTLLDNSILAIVIKGGMLVFQNGGGVASRGVVGIGIGSTHSSLSKSPLSVGTEQVKLTAFSFLVSGVLTGEEAPIRLGSMVAHVAYTPSKAPAFQTLSYCSLLCSRGLLRVGG
jgi:hypothetical protein